ncbi:MAG: McrC family protein [Vicinamibacterales bacterium]
MKLRLREHELSTPVRLDDDVVDVLLQPDSPVELRPARRGKWTVRTGSMVGVVRVGNFELRIEPKIGLRNVLQLMEFDGGGERWRTEADTFNHDEDLLIGFIRVFAATVDGALRGGVRSDYRPQEERLVSPRGRIDFPATFCSALPTPLPCHFGEYTTNIELNRHLRAAVELALRIAGVPPPTALRLRHALANFDGVPGARPDRHWYERWTPTRLDAHWRTSAALADQLLNGVSMSTSEGNRRGLSFLIDMNRLFERFVTERLRRLLPPPFVLADQHRAHLDRAARIAIKPDLYIERDGEPFLVADLKYKLTTDGRPRNEDSYQAVVYATALGVKDAALIYHAEHPGDTAPTIAHIRHSPIRLHTWPIDLRGTKASIDEQLQALADGIVSLGVDSSHVHASASVR